MRTVRYILIIQLLAVFNGAFAQTLILNEEEFSAKLDSIIEEGNLLYEYERSAWLSTDLAFQDSKINERIDTYLTYQAEEDIKTIMINDREECIVEYVFGDDGGEPTLKKIKNRQLDANEKELLIVRETLFDQLNSGKYAISIPEGYSLNAILIPFGDKYKFYIITGTSQQDIIPFGNDYLFIADKEGTIESWEKFHSSIIPFHTKIEGQDVVKHVHSHSRTNLLISATDICTFMLYAPLYKMERFSVYSPAINKYMTYDLTDNTIIVSDKD